jgi:hypothetical protein
MNHSQSTKSTISAGQNSLLQILAHVFTVLAVIISMVICFFADSTTLKHPEVLILASFLVLPRFARWPSLHILQKIITFYLTAFVMSQVSTEHFQVSFRHSNFTIAYTLVILLFFAAGFILSQLGRAHRNKSFFAEEKDLLTGWIVAIICMLCHMALLALMLNKFYGYGYEHDWSVVRNVCLYFLLFLFLWEQLSKVRLRQIIAVLSIALLIAEKFHG